jgi:hypothetical protein
MVFSLLILLVCLMVIGWLEHFFWVELARKRPVIGYTLGVLGVLVPAWLWALWARYSADYVDDLFLQGLALVSLAFVPFGATTALLHFIDYLRERE